MKNLFITLYLIIGASVVACAQSTIFETRQGNITFFSSAPLEDIEAKNNKVISLLNVRNNEIAVRVPIKQFQFRNRLMQEHFNENYMESERFPYATFKGKINESVDFSKPGVYNVTASGDLNVHGVSRKRTLTGILRVTDSGILMETKFDILLADHNIKIPRLVFNKIAERIAASVNISYVPQIK
jgi:polyisoprenoid-binding protein YceI